MNFYGAFIIALSTLSSLPVPVRVFPQDANEKTSAGSILFYPVVGLLFAFILIGVLSALPNNLPHLFQAVLILTVWVLLTGALHLDGLADSVDAAYASHKNTELALSVLKDPQSGPMAVVAVVLMLLLKLGGVYTILINDSLMISFIAFLYALMLSRVFAAIYIFATPYARENGMAAGLKHEGIRDPLVVVYALIAMSLFFFVGFVVALLLILTLGGCAWWWRRFWMKRIKGFTGDCVGAMIEITEVVCLVYFAFVFV